MNYGEELAYWYLRFNGFFPLNNFVLHRDSNNRNASDCDLLAIRHPFTYEEIGGHSDDWDPGLTSIINTQKVVGLICEVKTGKKIEGIFPEQNIHRCVNRLGFFSDTMSAKTTLFHGKTYSDDKFEISKLLIADRDTYNSNSTLFIQLTHVRSFLRGRIIKYSKEKNADRMFFKSTLLQQLIWEAKVSSDI